jgi:hypothetical protein
VTTATVEDGAWGTIKGQIILDPAVAIAAPKEISTVNGHKDQEHCLSKGTLFEEKLIVNKKNRGVRYAFFWLETADKSAPSPIHPSLKEIKDKDKEVTVDQPCCQFVPHALAIREGQVVVAKNSSPVAHNMNWTGFKNPGNNLLIPPGSQIKIDNLVADKFPIKVSCNIHPWMSSEWRVYNHPYFALTDEDGKFEIKLAPAGNFRLRGYHESVGYVPDNKGITITTKANETTDVGEIKLKPE